MAAAALKSHQASKSWGCLEQRSGSVLLLRSVLNDTHGHGLSVVSMFLSGGGLDLSGFSLLIELLLSKLLLLHLVDGLDQHGLVLELVTLGSQVEVMIDVLGDFLSFSVLLEESSENSLSSHPQNLGWHSSVSGTSSLTKAGMSTYKSANQR